VLIHAIVSGQPQALCTARAEVLEFGR
jgi:hypothetical protein